MNVFSLGIKSLKNSKLFKTVGIIVAAFVLVSAVVLVPAPVSAGSNGQQIAMWASCLGRGVYVSWARVTGTNQNNQQKVWPGSGGVYFVPPVISAVTNGWYWVGQTKVEYTLSNGKRGTTYTSVPRNFANLNWEVSLPC